jgi:hypothetical protein
LGYAPVKSLQREYDTLRREVNSTSIRTNPNWLAKKLETSQLLKWLMAAKENAFNDIYERMNSCGSMGLSFSGQSTVVDLHGLSVEGAKQIVLNTILPVLPVLKKIMVITGRGVHSQSGESVLKSSIKRFIAELNVRVEEVVGNDGAIYVFS